MSETQDPCFNAGHDHFRRNPFYTILTYVLLRTFPGMCVCGVAEKNHKNNVGFPVVYRADLHYLESGKCHFAPKKTTLGRSGRFQAGGEGVENL